MPKADKLARKFGINAIKKGYATKEQIHRALNEQKRLSAEGSTALISDILVAADVITEEQKNELLQAQKKSKESPEVKVPEPSADKKEEVEDQEDSEDQEEFIAPQTEYEDRFINNNDKLPEKIKNGKKVQNNSGYELTISTDKIEAYICPREETPPEVDLYAIKDLLKMDGIRYGIADDDMTLKYLSSKPSNKKLWLIAMGKAPDPGKTSKVKYHFDTDPLKPATIDEHGNIDYKNRGAIPHVEPGDILAEIVPDIAGKPGKNIYNEIAPPPEHKLAEILPGDGVNKIENGLKAVAEIPGRPEVQDNGTLLITDQLNVPGDIGIETGHIEFDGHIKVKGTVQEGYRVKCKTLEADEILKAKLEITDELIVKKGIIGASILSEGSIKATHIRDTTIDALGDINVAKEVNESHIETNGEFNIAQGTIVGSTVSAMKGIKAKEIGSPAATPSQLTVGIDNRVEKAIKKLEAQIEMKDEEKREIEKQYKELKDLSDMIEDKIGKMAQTQDLAILKESKLKNTLKILKETNDRKNMIKVATILKGLYPKLELIQKRLDSFTKQQEKTEDDLNAKNDERNKMDTGIQELQDDINSLVEMAKLRKSTAIVKASGTVYDQTFIKGQYSSITIQGNTKRIIVQEIKSQSKNKEYTMAVSSL